MSGCMLVGADMMLADDVRCRDASVRSIEVLTSCRPDYWKQLIDAGLTR